MYFRCSENRFSGTFPPTDGKAGKYTIYIADKQQNNKASDYCLSPYTCPHITYGRRKGKFPVGQRQRRFPLQACTNPLSHIFHPLGANGHPPDWQEVARHTLESRCLYLTSAVLIPRKFASYSLQGGRQSAPALAAGPDRVRATADSTIPPQKRLWLLCYKSAKNSRK